jgi:excisionase family DNA binding protein
MWKEVLQVEEVEYITVPEAARLAGKDPKTIRRWFNEQRLTKYRVGPRSVRVRRSELMQLITPQPVASPARKEAAL